MRYEKEEMKANEMGWHSKLKQINEAVRNADGEGE